MKVRRSDPSLLSVGSLLLFSAVGALISGCAPGEALLNQTRQSSANQLLTGYFNTAVVPKLQAKNCGSCHNAGVAGTFIFDYDFMREMLMRGPARDNNDLLRKVAGYYINPSGVHPGGDQCGYIGGEPCATIMRWWDREAAAFTPGGAGAPVGTTPVLVGSVSVNGQTGLIQGYAFDRNGIVTSVPVELYMNGPAGGGGVLLSQQAANQSRSSPPFTSGFSFQPNAATYVDARPRRLYAYIIDAANGNTKILINGTPYDFIAGSDTSGLNAFQTRVVPLLGQCNQCHGTSWNDYFNSRMRLASPSPLDGGTATNNRFYGKASGGLGHGGGNRCNGNALCAEIQAWYATDFGN